MCACVIHARKLCRTGETQECVHSVIKLTSMQTNPHVRTGTMGIPREGQCKQIRAELQSRPVPGAFIKGTPRPPGVAWGSGGRKCSSFQQGQTLSLCILPPLLFITVTCCPSETGLCAPAHVLPSGCAGHHAARPFLWVRQAVRESYQYGNTAQQLTDEP